MDYLEESLPQYIIDENNLPDIKTAVYNYHFPTSKEKLIEARKRFKFEELFFIELLVALRKRNHQIKLAGHSMSVKTNLVKNTSF